MEEAPQEVNLEKARIKFKELDEDNDGMLTKEEIKDSLDALDIGYELEKLMDDLNKRFAKALISEVQYLQFLLETQNLICSDSDIKKIEEEKVQQQQRESLMKNNDSDTLSLDAKKNYDRLRQIRESQDKKDEQFSSPDVWEFIVRFEKSKAIPHFSTILDSKEEPSFRFGITYFENDTRSNNLKLCGWHPLNFYQNAWRTDIDRIYKIDQEYPRALALAVFHFDFELALTVLKAMKDNQKTHHLFSPILKSSLEIYNFITQVTKESMNEESALEKRIRGGNANFSSGGNPTTHTVEHSYSFSESSKGRQSALSKFSTQTTTTSEGPDKFDQQAMLKLATFEDPNQGEFIKIKDIGLRTEIIYQQIIFVKNICSQNESPNPYLNAVLMFLSNFLMHKESEIFDFLEKQKEISTFDQIAYAMRFLKKSDLEYYFLRLQQDTLENGLIENVFMFLPNIRTQPDANFKAELEACDQIFQKYIEQTSDIQNLSLFSIKLIAMGFKDIDPELKWYRDFRFTLNSIKQYDERIKFDRDVARELEGSTLPNINFTSQATSGSSSMNMRQNMNINPKDLKSTQFLDLQYSSISVACHGSMKAPCSVPFAVAFSGIHTEQQKPSNNKDTTTFRLQSCQECQTDLPKCSLCYMPISIINPSFEKKNPITKIKHSMINPTSWPTGISLEEAIAWCQSCNHGGHFSHLYEWFEDFPECPYEGCSCRCDFKKIN